MSPVVKKEKEKFKLPSKYVLFLLTLVCMILMALSFFTNFMGGALNSVSGTLIVPFQEGVSAVGTFFADKVDEYKDMRHVYSENEELKAQIEALTNENILYKQEHYELENLRELLQLDDQYSNYEKLAATIIGKDAGNFYSSFIINRGEKDGLSVNMNVIADGGLVGRITKVGDHWARVLAIIDDTSNVSAMVLSTSDNLIVSGSIDLMYDRKISFSQLLDSNDYVAVGDKIVTSNISDKYLPGILIGYISEIELNSNNLSKSGKLTPVVDFEHLSDVYVILTLKQEIKENE